jgi:hypothetical protein
MLNLMNNSQSYNLLCVNLSVFLDVCNKFNT